MSAVVEDIPVFGFVVYDMSGPPPWPLLRTGMCPADILGMQGGPGDGVLAVAEDVIDAISDVTHQVDVGGLIVTAPPALPPSAEELALRARQETAITARQFFIALASPPWSYITPDEAIAAATHGTMPAAVEAAIAGFDPAAQIAARVTWARPDAGRVARLDPLVTALGVSQGASDAELDDFFAFAARL